MFAYASFVDGGKEIVRKGNLSGWLVCGTKTKKDEKWTWVVYVSV